MKKIIDFKTFETSMYNTIPLKSEFSGWRKGLQRKKILVDDTKDILDILDEIKNKPTADILKFKDAIEEVIEVSESMNESIFDNMIQKLRIKFDRWLDDKIWKRIINRKKEFYFELYDKMNIFDLRNMDDVVRNYPGFKLESLYFCGGMDKSIDVGAGWRNIAEWEFETYKRNENFANHKEIKFPNIGEIIPTRTIDGENIAEFVTNPNKIKKMYDVPAILDPCRKEVDRTKDVEFAAGLKKYKTFKQETEPEKYEPMMTSIRKTMSSSIEPDDEQLVRIVDGFFAGMNTAAAAGTFGELEMLSYMKKPLFVWMTDTDWEFKDFSTWTFPHITKLARNTEEMKILVKTLVDFAIK